MSDYLLPAFGLGLCIGALLVAGAVTYDSTGFSGQLGPAQPTNDTLSPENPVVTYEAEGTFERVLSFYSKDREVGVSCDVSRKDEVEIAEATFLYNNTTSCTARLPVGVEGNQSLSVDLAEGAEVFFKTFELGRHGIGFNFPERQQYVVCNVSEEGRHITESGDFVYNGSTSCSVSSGDLYRQWDNASFSDFFVYEEGRKVLGNESVES